MKKQAGFTMIELVMVIVILGILAAFALPRFADLGGDARAATRGGLEGAIRSSMAITRAACLANADCDTAAATDTIGMDGDTIDLVYGYPAGTQAGIGDAAQISGTTPTYSGGVMTISIAADCTITYTQATASAAPAIGGTTTCN